MKLSASVYAGQRGQLPALVRELDQYQIDCYHIDCLDDPSVFEDIRLIRSLSRTPIDLHIISPEPVRYAQQLALHLPEYVAFQHEDMRDPELPSLPDIEVGLAITADTPVSVFESYAERCSFVLLMTTTPGRSGGTFGRETFRRIRDFQRMFPGRHIHVDGGVTAEVSFILRNMGVSTAVVGSYLHSGEYLGAAVLRLHRENIGSEYRINDFMIETRDLPRLVVDELSVRAILESIEEYALGFTVVVDRAGRLVGVVTNADVRRGLLRSLGAVADIDPLELVNRRPVSIREDRTIAELLAEVKSVAFPLLWVPVVSSSGELVGAVTFNNLIKGEG